MTSVNPLFVKMCIPTGLEQLLEGLAREVLRRQPNDINSFAAAYFDKLLKVRKDANDVGADTDLQNLITRGKFFEITDDDINKVKKSVYSASESDEIIHKKTTEDEGTLIQSEKIAPAAEEENNIANNNKGIDNGIKSESDYQLVAQSESTDDSSTDIAKETENGHESSEMLDQPVENIEGIQNERDGKFEKSGELGNLSASKLSVTDSVDPNNADINNSEICNGNTDKETEQEMITAPLESNEAHIQINAGLHGVKSEVNTELNDAKSEDNGELNDVKSEDNGELNDAKSEDNGELNDAKSEDILDGSKDTIQSEVSDSHVDKGSKSELANNEHEKIENVHKLDSEEENVDISETQTAANGIAPVDSTLIPLKNEVLIDKHDETKQIDTEDSLIDRQVHESESVNSDHLIEPEQRENEQIDKQDVCNKDGAFLEETGTGQVELSTNEEDNLKHEDEVLVSKELNAEHDQSEITNVDPELSIETNVEDNKIESGKCTPEVSKEKDNAKTETVKIDEIITDNEIESPQIEAQQFHLMQNTDVQTKEHENGEQNDEDEKLKPSDADQMINHSEADEEINHSEAGETINHSETDEEINHSKTDEANSEIGAKEVKEPLVEDKVIGESEAHMEVPGTILIDKKDSQMEESDAACDKALHEIDTQKDDLEMPTDQIIQHEIINENQSDAECEVHENETEELNEDKIVKLKDEIEGQTGEMKIGSNSLNTGETVTLNIANNESASANMEEIMTENKEDDKAKVEETVTENDKEEDKAIVEEKVTENKEDEKAIVEEKVAENDEGDNTIVEEKVTEKDKEDDKAIVEEKVTENKDNEKAIVEENVAENDEGDNAIVEEKVTENDKEDGKAVVEEKVTENDEEGDKAIVEEKVTENDEDGDKANVEKKVTENVEEGDKAIVEEKVTENKEDDKAIVEEKVTDNDKEVEMSQNDNVEILKHETESVPESVIESVPEEDVIEQERSKSVRDATHIDLYSMQDDERAKGNEVVKHSEMQASTENITHDLKEIDDLKPPCTLQCDNVSESLDSKESVADITEISKDNKIPDVPSINTSDTSKDDNVVKTTEESLTEDKIAGQMPENVAEHTNKTTSKENIDQLVSDEKIIIDGAADKNRDDDEHFKSVKPDSNLTLNDYNNTSDVKSECEKSDISNISHSPSDNKDNDVIHADNLDDPELNTESHNAEKQSNSGSANLTSEKVTLDGRLITDSNSAVNDHDECNDQNLHLQNSDEEVMGAAGNEFESQALQKEQDELITINSSSEKYLVKNASEETDDKANDVSSSDAETKVEADVEVNGEIGTKSKSEQEQASDGDIKTGDVVGIEIDTHSEKQDKTAIDESNSENENSVQDIETDSGQNLKENDVENDEINGKLLNLNMHDKILSSENSEKANEDSSAVSVKIDTDPIASEAIPVENMNENILENKDNDVGKDHVDQVTSVLRSDSDENETVTTTGEIIENKINESDTKSVTGNDLSSNLDENVHDQKIDDNANENANLNNDIKLENQEDNEDQSNIVTLDENVSKSTRILNNTEDMDTVNNVNESNTQVNSKDIQNSEQELIEHEKSIHNAQNESDVNNEVKPLSSIKHENEIENLVKSEVTTFNETIPHASNLLNSNENLMETQTTEQQTVGLQEGNDPKVENECNENEAESLEKTEKNSEQDKEVNSSNNVEEGSAATSINTHLADNALLESIESQIIKNENLEEPEKTESSTNEESSSNSIENDPVEKDSHDDHKPNANIEVEEPVIEKDAVPPKSDETDYVKLFQKISDPSQTEISDNEINTNESVVSNNGVGKKVDEQSQEESSDVENKKQRQKPDANLNENDLGGANPDIAVNVVEKNMSSIESKPTSLPYENNACNDESMENVEGTESIAESEIKEQNEHAVSNDENNEDEEKFLLKDETGSESTHKDENKSGQLSEDEGIQQAVPHSVVKPEIVVEGEDKDELNDHMSHMTDQIEHMSHVTDQNEPQFKNESDSGKIVQEEINNAVDEAESTVSENGTNEQETNNIEHSLNNEAKIDTDLKTESNSENAEEMLIDENCSNLHESDSVHHNGVPINNNMTESNAVIKNSTDSVVEDALAQQSQSEFELNKLDESEIENKSIAKDNDENNVTDSHKDNSSIEIGVTNHLKEAENTITKNLSTENAKEADVENIKTVETTEAKSDTENCSKKTATLTDKIPDQEVAIGTDTIGNEELENTVSNVKDANHHFKSESISHDPNSVENIDLNNSKSSLEETQKIADKDANQSNEILDNNGLDVNEKTKFPTKATDKISSESNEVILPVVSNSDEISGHDPVESDADITDLGHAVVKDDDNDINGKTE